MYLKTQHLLLKIAFIRLNELLKYLKFDIEVYNFIQLFTDSDSYYHIVLVINLWFKNNKQT